MSNEDLDAFGGPAASDATISIPDMEGVQIKTFHLPPGWYSAVCLSFEDTVSKANNAMLVFEFEIGDHVSGTIKKKQHCTTGPGGLPFLKKAFIAMDVPVTTREIKASKFVGRRLEVKVADDPYDGGIGSKIADMRKHPQGAVVSGGIPETEDDLVF